MSPESASVALQNPNKEEFESLVLENILEDTIEGTVAQTTNTIKAIMIIKRKVIRRYLTFGVIPQFLCLLTSSFGFFIFKLKVSY